VIPGFTQQDTVFVSIVTPPLDYTGIIYLGGLLTAVGALAAAIVVRKARSARRQRRNGSRQAKSVRAKN
jgi:hypothetical protein